MGLAIDREHFEERDYERFTARLERSLVALRQILDRPDFGAGPASLGAELELFLVDAAGRPLPLNEEVVASSLDPRVTVELNRFNLECNLRPSPLAGRPFAALEAEIVDSLDHVRRAAAVHGGRVAMIGILPTLRESDLARSAMTDSPRFRALSAGIQRLRQEPFRVNIDGDDPLEITCDDVTYEGANTSLQVHLRVAPDDFADLYNAVQMATGPALAVAANSPTFLGHRLWRETRVALFKQAVDDRGQAPRRRDRVARVSFGNDWVREGAFELFLESVALHEPLLPVLSDEDPIECTAAGGVPRLDEVRLHQGTVWRWNRAIYDPVDGGHLRIEMRGLPAGPTVVDMLANTAFLVGLALDLAREGPRWTRSLSFERAHGNFYRAAQYGLDARLYWPPAPDAEARPHGVAELVRMLLPRARAGLAGAGVDPDDSDRLLSVIEERSERGRSGAVWQRRVLDALEPRVGRSDALAEMLQRYLTCAETGEPVHLWPLDV